MLLFWLCGNGICDLNDGSSSFSFDGVDVLGCGDSVVGLASVNSDEMIGDDGVYGFELLLVLGSNWSNFDLSKYSSIWVYYVARV